MDLGDQRSMITENEHGDPSVLEVKSARSSLKILYVINSVEGGGAAFPVPRIVQALERSGAEVHVLALTPRDRRALPAFVAAGSRIEVREGTHGDHAAALRWLDQRCRSVQPDVIWTSLSRATLLGQILGQWRKIPVISWQHAAYLKRANAMLLRARRSRSRLWIADSRAVAAITQKRLKVPEERIITWPIFAARHEALQSQRWVRGQRIRIGSLGRLHPVKGYDVLIDAAAYLNRQGFRAPCDWRIAVAGAGKQQDALIARTQAAGVPNVCFTGFEDNPSLFLADQHAYVQPSRSEGFCVAAHEAMQAGLPVLASSVGELANSIDADRTGWQVPPGDPVKLADGLAKLLSSPDRLHEMGQKARAFVLDQFSEDAFDRVGCSIAERLVEIVQAG